MKIFRLLFFLFTMIPLAFLSAQEYSYKQYTVQDGLVQSQVLSIFQDSKGFLWVGTKGGVSRFDGISFQNFTHKDGLPDNNVYRITEDHDGNIWFLTKDGLAKYIGKELIAYPTNHFKQISAFVIFCEPKIGELLIVFHDKEKVRFVSFSQGKYNALAVTFSLTNWNSEKDDIFGVYDPIEKSVWLVMPKSKLIKIQDNQIFEMHFTFQNPQALNLGKDGNMYLMDDNKVYINKKGTFIELFSYGYPFYRSSNSIFEIDQGGVIYFSSLDLSLFQNNNLIHEHYNFNNILVLYIDNEGNLWIGSETGLYRLISRAFVNFIPEKCGINHLIWSIAEDKNGRIKFASYEHGLQDFDGNKIIDDKSFENIVTGEKYHFYMGSIVDKEKNILFTTVPNGGLKYDGKKFSRIFPDSITFGSFIFYEDPDNFDLLAGTNKGLFIKTKSNGIKKLNIKPGNGNSQNIVSIVKDKYKRYWLGGFKGISLLDGKDVIHLPTPEITFEEGGNAMLVDSLQNIWIGNAEGLYFCDNKSFRQIEDPSLNSMITSLSIIGDSTLIIGSVTGLALLDLNAFYQNDTIKMTVFDKETGFQGIEVGQNGIFKDSKGQYWIPTSDRVVRFDPSNYKKNNFAPWTYISSISLLSKQMEWEKVENDKLKKLDFQFKNSEKNLRFEFTGISLSNPEGVMYSHFLEGYDNGWSEPEHYSYAVYTNLAPGNYTLFVKACNSDGSWTKEPTSISFSIKPAFYQLIWFWIIFVALASAALLFIGASIMKRKKLKQQEHLETEKRMVELRLLNLQNQIEPHFTFNALNSIASIILKEDKNLAYSYFVKFSKLIRRTMSSSESLVRSIDDEIAFVKDYLDINRLRFEYSFEYTVFIDPEIELSDLIPNMTIQTFVENAIKHGLADLAGNGKLKIEVLKNNGNLHISVEDNGVGREKARQTAHLSTGKGLKILTGYFDYFNSFNKQKINWKIIDLYKSDGTAAGTRVEVNIPEDYIYKVQYK